MNNVKEKLEKVVELYTHFNEEATHLKETLYNECGYDFSSGANGFKYEIEDKVAKYKKDLEVCKLLGENTLEVRHYLTSNVYLEVFYNDRYHAFFFVDDDEMLYDNYIGSHSGINEWVTKTICDEYDLFSGNSAYNYAFGTYSLNSVLKTIEAEDTEPNVKAKIIKKLINFVENRDEPLNKIIVEMLNIRFTKLEEAIQE